VDLSKLTRTDRIIAGSGLLLFISSFLPWFDVSVSASGIGESGSESGNGWDVGFIWGGIPALLGLLAAVLVVATKAGSATTPQLPVSMGQAFLGAGALSALLVVLKLLIGEDAPNGLGFFDVDISRAWGLFVATIAALAFAGGGYLAFQEEKSAGPSGGPSF
jgi:hypothetical protein